MNRKLLNFLLLGLILGLVALIYFEPGKTPTELNLLTSISVEQIETITIENPTQDELSFVKRDDHWHLIKPFNVPVRDYQVDSLLKLVTTPSYWTTASTEGNSAEFGFDKPRNRVQLGETWFEFGTTHPIEPKRYVRVGGNIHLVDDHFYHHTGVDWTGWAEKKLVPPGAKLVSVRFFDRLLKQTEKGWQLEPAQAEKDAAQLMGVWEYAAAFALEEIKEVDPEETGSANVVIEFEQNGQTEQRQFTAEQKGEDWLFQRHDLPLIYRLTQSQAENLLLLKTEEAPAAEDAGTPRG